MLDVYVIHNILRNVPLNEKFYKPQMTALLADIWEKERK